MQLIKFCNPEHNIQRGANLRLGTLYGYRSIEDSAIRDEEEGIFEFIIEFPDEIELDLQWCSLLFQGVIGFGLPSEIPRIPGGLSVQVENIHIIRTYEDRVVLKDTIVRITRNVHNCLVFCMSQFEEINTFPFDKYKDFWSFSTEKADNFSLFLAELILQKENLNDLYKYNSTANISNLNIICKHGKILYKSRHLNVTKNNQPSFNELIKILSTIEFIKPESFQHENEYRFIFELNDEKNIFPIQSEELLLTLNQLSNFNLFTHLNGKLNIAI